MHTENLSVSIEIQETYNIKVIIMFKQRNTNDSIITGIFYSTFLVYFNFKINNDAKEVLLYNQKKNFRI